MSRTRQTIKNVGQWFDRRLGFSEVFLPMLRHPVPRELEGPMGWWYVFGSASLTFLLIQILTGIGLATISGSPYTNYWTTDFGGYTDAASTC